MKTDNEIRRAKIGDLTEPPGRKRREIYLVLAALFSVLVCVAARQASAAKYDQIEFVIVTADDDLRGNSSATATLEALNGTKLQVVTLKTEKEHAWDNNSSHSVKAELKPPLDPSEIDHIVIRLTSHNGPFETDDNWNVGGVTVLLSNKGAGPVSLLQAEGTPLVRLTGKSPSITLTPERQGAKGTYDQIDFEIETGGDDLRGDSSAAATLLSPNGTPLQVITLKTEHEGAWGNNSKHAITSPLNPPRRPETIGHVEITLTSHNSRTETDDNWNVQSVIVAVSNNGNNTIPLVSGSGNPLQRLTGSLGTLVLDNPKSERNVLGPQPGNSRLVGFVDLHAHPLANLAFGGKMFYGGVDVGALLPTDPDCHHNVRALCMQQALGHDASTHGGPGINLNPLGTGDVGLKNLCGDLIRAQVIHNVQTGNKATDESEDARGAPDFDEWPNWNDITHQKMWVDWIRRSYCGGQRVLVALAVNNKTLGDMVSGPGDYATDDKTSADLQINETKAFIGRHSDFMEIAYSPEDFERIVRANKLAVVLGMEVDDIGNFNHVRNLSDAEIIGEIDRLYGEGVRYMFPIHLLDNRFGGTAIYNDLFNYSNARETGQWYEARLVPELTYTFQAQGSFLFDSAMLVKLGKVYDPPRYPTPPKNATMGLANIRGLTVQGTLAIKEMMRRGMLIDIDHMSDLSKNQVLDLALATGAGYPLNSGHSNLRSLSAGGTISERSTTQDQYVKIAKLHGMAGIGTTGMDAYHWVKLCQSVMGVMGPNTVLALGTDTDGLSGGMPPRSNPGSNLRYDDEFPRSRLGVKVWDYNKDGVAHYGMLPDFLKDARTAPAATSAPGNTAGTGAAIVENVMFGADFFLQTWKQCEAQKTNVQ